MKKKLLSILLALSLVLGMMPISPMQVKAAGSELPVAGMSAVAGDEYGSDAASNVLDGNPNSIWHTNWYADTPREKQWITISLGGMKYVDGLRYLPRQNNQQTGTILQYKVSVSSDGSSFKEVSSGTWANDKSWKTASFAEQKAAYVKLQALDTAPDTNPEQQYSLFASAAEIRITGREILNVNATIIVDGMEQGITVTEGETIGNNLPADPVKTGYTFQGWNTKADGTGTVVTKDTVVTEGMTIYAVFEEDVKEDVLTALVSGNYVTGTSLRDIVDKEIKAGEIANYAAVGKVVFKEGIVTEQDLAFIKNNLVKVTLISSPSNANIVYHDANGNVSKKIPNHAFEGMTNLVGVEILSNTFNEIGAYALADTPRLCSVQVRGLERVDEGAFKIDPAKISANQDKWSSFERETYQVKYIGAGAFEGRIHMSDISLMSIEEIGDNAFRNLPKLNSFIISSGTLKKIGANAFSVDEAGIAVPFSLWLPNYGKTNIPEVVMDPTTGNHPFMNRNGVLGNYTDNTVPDDIDAALRASNGYNRKTNTWCGFALKEIPKVDVLTALVDGQNYVKGSSLQDIADQAIEAGKIAQYSDITKVIFQGGIITEDDFAFIREEIPDLVTLSMPLYSRLEFHDSEGKISKKIPDHAFEGLQKLSLLTIKTTGFNEIGAYAFADTPALSIVEITEIAKIGEGAFKVDPAKLTGSWSTYDDVNADVKIIGADAFMGRNKFTTVFFNGVQEIGANAFRNLPKLKSFNTNQVNLKKIGANAFSVDDGIEAVPFTLYMNKNATTLPVLESDGTAGNHPFMNRGATGTLGNYTSIEQPLDATMRASAQYDKKANTWCGFALLELPKPDPVVFVKLNGGDEVGGASLEDIIAESDIALKDLVSVEFVSGVITQDDLACIKTLTYLETLKMNLSDTLTLTGADGNPTTVLSPTTAVIECAAAPSGWSRGAITTLELGGFTEIQEGGLKSVGSAETIKLPDVVTVGKSAFSNCEWLETLDLSSAKVIGDYAFLYLQRLKNLTLQSVETIGVDAFKYTDSLTKLTFPATLKSMENISFGLVRNGNKSGTVVTMEGSVPPTVASGAFSGVSNGTVVVPNGALQAYVSQHYPNADASKVLTSSQATWNNLKLKEVGTYRVEYLVPQKSWLTQYAYVPVGTAVTGDKLATVKESDMAANQVFTGWNTKSNGTGEAFTAETVPTGDISVYAVLKDAWIASFDVEGTVTTAKVIKGEAIGDKMPEDPTKADYVFTGWNTAADGTGEVVTKDTVLTANTTIYAIFEEETAVVTAKINGELIGGKSLEAVITKSGVKPSDVESIEFVAGTITPADLAYMKSSTTYLEDLKMNLSEALTLVDADGNPSTVLPGKAFQNSRLESIELGGFTEIGGMAFQGATSLANVSMPNMEVIGSNAFYRTDDYENIVIPASIKVLNDCGFGVAMNGTKEIHVVMEGAVPPTVTGSPFKSANAASDVTVPAGTLPVYLSKLDLTKDFGTSGETKWNALRVIDPEYHLITYRGKNSYDIRYAYVHIGEAVTESRIPVTFNNVPFVLVGWNTKNDGTGLSLDATTVPESDMLVYAQWKELFTVTVNVDDVETTIKVIDGEAIGDQLPADPVKPGYDFTGWNTQADGAGEAVTKDTVVEKDTTIYATFDKQEYTVNVVGGEHVNVTPSGEIKVEYGDDLTIGFEAEDGYSIEKVVIDGKEYTGKELEDLKGSYTFENVDKAPDISFVTVKNPILTWYFQKDNGEFELVNSVSYKAGTYELRSEEELKNMLGSYIDGLEFDGWYFLDGEKLGEKIVGRIEFENEMEYVVVSHYKTKTTPEKPDGDKDDTDKENNDKINTDKGAADQAGAKTGDTTNAGMFVVMMLFAAAAIAVIFDRKRKQKRA